MHKPIALGALAAAMLGAGHAHAVDCSSLPDWDAATAYVGGDQVQHNSNAYEANWWTRNQDPELFSDAYQEWSLLGACDGTIDPLPVGSITSPTTGSVFSENDSVIISVDASDDQQVVVVEFYVDGSLVASDTSAPYSTTWSAVAGSPVLSARIEDNAGQGILTDDVVITVESGDPQPPSVSLSEPLDGSSFTTGDSVTIAASASDSDGSVSAVEFFVDGNSIGSDTSAPFSASWTATAGSHTITATATDNDGQSSDSAPVTISATDADNKPTVTLDSPAAGSTFDEGVTVSLAATASDAEGDVARVEFFVAGQEVGEDSSAPFAVEWTAVAGTASVYARAYDSAGQWTDSAPVSITVNGEPVVTDHPCRPDGLFTTPGTAPDYCDVYTATGHEAMGTDHPRRIIGYFTSWRNGANGQPSYLVDDIPWDKITHINYAFAHIDDNNQVSVGNTANPDNPATGMTWPGVEGAEMDPEFAYQGHFNLLSKFKKQHPQVKTLISVGGWAETGGYFNEFGDRVDNGGFYTMTTNADGTINHAGIETFANSAVEFIREYGFDGVDIDYEYPTSMNDAGNPLDFGVANPLRGSLMESYVELMRVLRQKLDIAGEQDDTHYLLTIASPSSGYLLRGMETMPITQYLDYVNIMTYDLHGAWNEYVGHNSALFDNGNDPELAAASVYSTSQYGGIGYLNIDWAVKYFRGSMSPGRINIGIPYYTRGWQGVTGGNNGLGGTAALPDQTQCPEGTGGAADCGYGALGIDNLWHDLDENGNEMGAGSNPMWHARNLENGIQGSYLDDYGLDPANNPADALVGTYVRNYDSVSEAPWLWNDTKDVFLSTEDEESMEAKVQYVIDQGVGGIMFWELAGDYDWDAATGEYFMGDTLTTLAYDRFANAAPYRELRSDRPLPAEALDISMEVTGFKLGDQNYPLNPQLVITNNTGGTLPGGTVFEFDMPTATSNIITDQSGAGLEVIEDGANPGGGNVGGLENEFHRVRFSLPSWQSLADGESWELTLNYYLPVSGPQAYTATVNGTTYALAFEYPDLPLGTVSSGGSSDDGGSGGDSCADAGVATSGLVTYPVWPDSDHANGGDRIIHNDSVYEANWWTNSEPGTADGSWTYLCNLN
ncbi:chitinase C-terminal domain-containing protein [Microbulbifer zhoushanensis]|uniref:chitinase C-terminal domain-containing protein n=1 Tax=Microbulbifer zhoushanensis TaxID=2904254 RepID=UPI001F01F225|nr:glycosyl hydrolase family 18 protein [Microbulbifer zhoushanensis]